MESQSYYRLDGDNGCNFLVTDQPLTINCTGVYLTEAPFSNLNREGRHDYYLMYLCQGKLEVTAGEKNFLLQAGEAIIYPPESCYGYRKSTSERMCYYWAHFSGTGVEALFKRCGLNPGQLFHPGNREEAAESFQELFRCFYGREPLFEMEAAGMFTALLAQLARWSRQRNEDMASVTRIRKSLEYLYHNYTLPIRLEELAEIEHLSPSRYSAVFRACMGISPQGFLIGLRMKNAADLIRRTDLTIGQIAHVVGYEDPLYFSGLFHKKMGLSPSCYRDKFGGR